MSGAQLGAEKVPRTISQNVFYGLGAIAILSGAAGWILQEQLMESHDIAKIPLWGHESLLLNKKEAEVYSGVVTALGVIVYVVLGKGKLLR